MYFFQNYFDENEKHQLYTYSIGVLYSIMHT